MPNKVYPDAKSAVEGMTFDGMTVVGGGFVLCGIPENLILALQPIGAERSFVEAHQPHSGAFLAMEIHRPLARNL